MQARIQSFWKRYHLWAAGLAAVLGFGWFLYQAVGFADKLPPFVWDESMYLYKGYLFATGRYQPFQDYGPWTNQLPLAFLIPGYIQKWFGPSMLVGRTYAVVVGSLAVIGVWLAVRRSANPWWAAAVVWVIALNPAYVQVFSQSFAQTLVSMFFAWMLVFSVGPGRQDWELALAAFLAGLAGMSRVNVLPVLPIFILYIFWQYGPRTGWKALVAGLAPVVVLHAIYWPNILKFWAYWINPDVFPWITAYRSPFQEVFLPDDFSWFPLSNWLNDPTHLAWSGIRTFGQTVRINFVVLIGVLAVLLLLPWRRKFAPSDETSISKTYFNIQKQNTFLLVTFIVMLIIHLWAANGHSCRFSCLPGYIMFFFVFGLVLIPASAQTWAIKMPLWRQILVVAVLIGVWAGTEYNFNADYLTFRYDLIRNTFDQPIPQALIHRTAPVWQLLENKFGYDHYPLRQFIIENEQMVTILYWTKILGIVLVLTPIAYWLIKKIGFKPASFGHFALYFTLLIGIAFGGNYYFGDFYTFEPCEDSVIASYQQVGDSLAELIPPGSQMYWNIKANMLALYLPERETFTPQLNSTFTYLNFIYPDPDTLYKFGWWDQTLEEQWIQEADFILVEQRFFDETWQQRLDNGEVEQIFVTEPTAICRGDGTRILVLQTVP